MLLYIAATNRVVSVVVVVEREEEGKTVQRPVYYLSEVLSSSKQNYPHFQKMTYGVFMAATKLKHYFEEHPMKVVSEAPISDIMGNKDASGRIAKWAIQLSPYVPVYERRDAIKSQALADFLVDWAEIQYKPPEHKIEYWKMHFDGSKLKEGLGAGVVLTSPKGDHLRYVLQVHFRASNNVAEYEALIHGLKVAKEIGALRIICYGDSDLVVQQCSGDWDAKDANMASYRFHVQKIAGFFEGCEFHHVPRAENEAADALSKLGSSRQEIPPGIALAHLRVPSIKPSPESESIFVPESHVVPMEIDEGNPGTAPANSGTVPVNSGTATPMPEEAMLVDSMDIDMPVFVVREAPSWVKPIKEFLVNGTLPVDENESRRIQRRSKAYTIINGEAYKRSVTGVLQRCVEPEEGREMLEEIHRGECGHHASSRALVAKVFRHGFYWPTALENAEDMTVAIPYTCGSSRLFSGAVAGEHSFIWKFTWIDIVRCKFSIMGKPRDTKIAILPSTTRKGTTLSTSAALDSPSVIDKLVSPPHASRAGTSAESENSHNIDNVSAVLDDSGSLGSFLDATIAKSRQIENTETPNENAATPVNSPESVEYSSDDLDEDYVELDDDFIEKCNATTDARKIKKLLAEHAVRYKLSPDPKFATSPINIRDKDYDFSLDLSHIAIVEKTPFCGTEKESAVEHMTELSTLDLFSLKDDAKTWKRTPEDAEELLAKIGRNHDDWSTPEPTPTPIVKKRGMIKLNDEDMREAKKSLKEKGIKPEDVKNLPPIEDICETIPPSSMIEDPLYPEGHPKRVEQDSQLIKTSAPSKKKKKKHKNVVESSEPVNDPNSISISDAETESGNEHEEDNDKNDTPDKEEIEKEPEKPAKNKKYTKEDFITEKHGAVIDCNKGMVTFNVDDKEHTVYFPKRIDKDFEFHRSRTDPMVRYKIYNKTIDLPFSDFCTAIRVPQWGSCEKIRGTPRELSNLYTRICNGRSFSNDGVRLPAPALFNLDARDGWSITENELNAYIERESRRAREDVEETEEHPDSSSDAASSSYQHHGHVEPPRYSSAQGPYYHSMYDPPAWNSDPRWE
ncbi:hypothetical protein QYE76_051136 [Lolium multiflorum]|uniref:RNase H type-1 domain-containing protein n=1 Tax=Lolium multiflorum TaxID=4521 RepID=A0AAD8WHM0_LOLMU|nr:hypothetical protein QYE76_051136 [Lolium multiflorum]